MHKIRRSFSPLVHGPRTGQLELPKQPFSAKKKSEAAAVHCCCSGLPQTRSHPQPNLLISPCSPDNPTGTGTLAARWVTLPCFVGAKNGQRKCSFGDRL